MVMPVIKDPPGSNFYWTYIISTSMMSQLNDMPANHILITLVLIRCFITYNKLSRVGPIQFYTKIIVKRMLPIR